MSPDKPISSEEKLVTAKVSSLPVDIRKVGFGNTRFRDLVSRSVLELARKKAEDLESQIDGFVDFDELVLSANYDIEPLYLQEYLALRRQFKRAELEHRTLQTEDSKVELEAVREELTNFLVNYPELSRFSFSQLVTQLEEIRNTELQIISDIRAGRCRFLDGRLVYVEDDALVPEAERYAIINQYIQSSSNQQKLNSLYQTLGMAQMIILGDWSVDRREGVSAALGVESLANIEAKLLNFHREYGSIKSIDPTVDEKLVHVHFGPGNGILMETLRRESTIDPFGNGYLLNDYFQEIGYGDKIYFTLNALLTKFVNPDLSEDEKAAIDEFIYVVSTLVLRAIHYGSKFGLSNSDKYLLQLPKDVNSLRKILLTLGSQVKNIARKKSINADKEFLSDEPLPISDTCLDLLAIFDPEKADSAELISQFFDKYFDPRLFDESDDLSKHITMWGQNVMLGRFEEFEEVFPVEPSIDLGHSVRGTSHLDDKNFISLLGSITKRLKPGGVYIDDGIRESYTRFLRVNKTIPHGGLLDLEQSLGPEYKIYMVVSEGNPKSIYIERGLLLEDGSYAFFSEYAKSDLMPSGSELHALADFYTRMPEIAFRNQVLDRVKRVFVTQTLSDKDDESVRIEKTKLGRSRFSGVHQRIESLLADLFDSEEWRRVRDNDDTNSLETMFDKVWTDIMNQIPEISKQDNIIRNKGLIPSQRISALNIFPQRAYGESTSFDVAKLPRNTILPRLEDLEDERHSLVERLSLLSRYGQIKHGPSFKAIKVLEFGSYTDKIARRFFTTLFADKVNEYVEFVKFNPENLDAINSPQEGSIYYFGGSELELSSLRESKFDPQILVGLLNKVALDSNIRIIGSGFGHQLLLGAYGVVSGSTHYVPQERELYVGPFEVEFLDNPVESTNVGFELVGKRISAPFLTNSVISPKNPAYDESVQITAIASAGNEPVVTELFDQRVLSSQPNTEIRLSNPSDVKAITRFIARNIDQIDQKFDLPYPGNAGRNVAALNRQLRPQAITKFGLFEPWIQTDFGLPLMVSTLNRQVQSLIEDLGLNL